MKENNYIYIRKQNATAIAFNNFYKPYLSWQDGGRTKVMGLLNIWQLKKIIIT